MDERFGPISDEEMQRRLASGEAYILPNPISDEEMQRRLASGEATFESSPFQNFLSKADDYQRAAFQGLTLGAGDELIAAGKTGLDFINSRILGNERSDKGYEDYLAEDRARLKSFQNENPKTDLALNVAGSIPTGMMVGVPTTLLGTLGVGGLLGGVSGFASGEGALDRAKGGAVGAGLGAGIGAVGAGIGKVAEKLGLGRLASALLSSEKGSIGAPTSKLSPEELLFAERVKYVSPDKLMSAKDELASAASDQIPLYAADVLPDSGLPRLTQTLVNSTPARSKILNAYESRMDALPSRLESALLGVSPENSPYQAGKMLSESARGAQSNIAQELSSEFNPQYEQILTKNPVITDPSLSQWMQTPFVKQASKLAKTATPDRMNLPENSSRIIKETISDLRQNLRADKFTPTEKRHMTVAINALNDMMPKGIKELDDQFAQAVTRRESASGGIVGRLANISEERYAQAGKDLLNLRPEQMTSFLNMMGEDSIPAIRAGIRGYYQDLIESGKTNWIKPLLSNPKQQNNLKAIMGEEDANTLLSFLSRENKIQQGTRFTFGNSDTAFKLQDEQTLAQQGRGLLNALRSPTNAVIDYFTAKTGLSPEVAEKLGGLLTNPNASVDLLERVIPYIKSKEKDRLLNALITGRGSQLGGLGGQAPSRSK